MRPEEKIYFRESLGVQCSSSQLAYSFLEGRVSKDEIFSRNGKKIPFEELLIQDECIREIICARGDAEVLHPDWHKFDSLRERYKLFKKIVLRGDDSLASLLVENSVQKRRIAELQEAHQADLRQLESWQKSNEELASQLKQMELSAKEDDVPRVDDSIASLLEENSVQKRRIAELLETHQADLRQLESWKKSNEELASQLKQMELSAKGEAVKERIHGEIGEIVARKQNGFSVAAVEDDGIASAMLTLENMQQVIKAKAKEIFSHVPLYYARCYLAPEIPETVLYNVACQCWGDVTRKEILAFFDCSLFRNGKAGILVSTSAFYIFKGEAKEKYMLNQGNTIETSTSEKSGCGVRLLGYFVILFVILPLGQLFLMPFKASEVGPLSLLFFVVALFWGCLAIRGKVRTTVKLHNRVVATFNPGDVMVFEKFCGAINQLSGVVSAVREQYETKNVN